MNEVQDEKSAVLGIFERKNDDCIFIGYWQSDYYYNNRQDSAAHYRAIAPKDTT